MVKFDATDADFLEYFTFDQLPHYGVEMHLEVWDKDYVTPDDFIGSYVLALGQQNQNGSWVPSVDFINNEYTAEQPLAANTTQPEAAGGLRGHIGFIQFRLTSNTSPPAGKPAPQVDTQPFYCWPYCTNVHTHHRRRRNNHARRRRRKKKAKKRRAARKKRRRRRRRRR